MKYNMSEIMSKAWSVFRKYAVSFAEALHRAWISAKARPINDQRIADAKAASGITEECNTWTGWRAKGYEVRHGEKSLFQAILIYGSKGDGASYTASFFSASQVDAIA